MNAASNNVLDNHLVGTGLSVLLLILCCYVGGRLHQFFRQTVEREQAYREGYNTATKSLFSLATRTAKAMMTSTPLDAPPMLDRPARKRLAAPPVKMIGSAPVSTAVPPEAVAAVPVKRPRHRAAGKSTLQSTQKFTAWDIHRSA